MLFRCLGLDFALAKSCFLYIAKIVFLVVFSKLLWEIFLGPVPIFLGLLCIVGLIGIGGGGERADG